MKFLLKLWLFFSIVIYPLKAENVYYSPDDSSNVILDNNDLLNMSLEELMNINVYSVSKKAEKASQTPATVIVITSDDIKMRGYTDLEQIFHDLPGFDISRGNGNDYSTIYQRGYRSQNIDRTLLLIDGVEDNDIWKGNVWLSRQYALSNIDRIEVIYGPASTMYGANAFAGVINIITKNPEANTKNKPTSVSGSLGFGSWNTFFADITYSQKLSEATSLQITGRYFNSDEMDLSKYPDFDYNLDYGDVFVYNDDFYKKKLTVSKAKNATLFKTLMSKSAFLGTYYTVGVSGSDSILIPTSLAITNAKNLDKKGIDTTLYGKKVKFSDITRDWMLDARIQSGDFILGVQTWQRFEGNNTWYTEWQFPGGKQGRTWTPEHTFFYAKYSKELSDKVSIQLSSNFVNHYLNEDYSRNVGYYSYAKGNLTLNDLINNKQPYYLTTYYYVISNQFRSEAKVIYQPFDNFSNITGVEFRTGLIQGDYVTANVEYPSEKGKMRTNFPEGNHFFHRDIGIYTQSTYKPFEDLALTYGIRMDNNKIRSNGGYGTVFNSRAAIVYTPQDFIFKIIYAQAFKDADYWQKYSTAGQRLLNNPGLKPEKVNNIDAMFGWQVYKNLYFEVVGYHSIYTGAIGTVVVPYGNTTTTQLQPVGEYKISGIQSQVNYKYENYLFTANYSFTDAINTKTETGLSTNERIGDIAYHRVNFIVNAIYFDNLNINFKINYVGERKTGAQTTIKSNPLNKIDPYTVLSSTITYKNILPGMDIQLYLNNILNTKYYHPGLRAADGFEYVARVPQNEFNFMLKTVFNL